MLPICLRCLLPAVLLLPVSAVQAQTFDKSWTGASSTSWTTASNWSPSGAPGSTQSVLINNQGASLPVLSASTASVTDVAIGVGAQGGQLTIGANGVLQTFNLEIGRAEQAGFFVSPGNGLLRISGASARLSPRAGAIRTLSVGQDAAIGELEVLNGGRVDGPFNIVVSSALEGQGDILVSGSNSLIDLGASSARIINLLANGRMVVRSGGAVNLLGTIRVEDQAQLATGALDSQAPQPAGNITAGTIDLPASGSKFTLNHSGNATVFGSVQGVGALRAMNGLSIMVGTVGSSVNVVVDSGAVLQFGNNGTTGTLAGNAQVAGAIGFTRSDNYTYNGVISGPGGLVVGGSGGLRISAPQTYTGGTQVFSGVLELIGGGRITGPVQNNFALLFNQSDSWTWSGNSSGTGALGKRGTGTLTLTGTHSHSGGTQVDLGTLRLNGGGLNNPGGAVFVGTSLTQPAILQAETGSVLITGPTVLGANVGSQGEMNLNNAVWTVSGSVVVGNNGRGHLEVRNGTTVNLDSIAVAASSAQSSTLRVQGPTSRLSAANLMIIGGNGSGTGLLELVQGTEVSAGQVQVGTATGRTVEDVLYLAGGSLLEVAQTFEQGSASALEIILSSPGGGRVQVSETATIAPGARLRVMLDGFNPPSGTQYTLLTAAGGLTGSYILDTSIPDATLIHSANSVILQIGEVQDEIFRDRFQ